MRPIGDVTNMAMGKEHKRQASKDISDATKKKQRVQGPPQKRIPAELALHSERILRRIISRLPLIERLRARRIAKQWTKTVDTFPDLHDIPFYEPQDKLQEFIVWLPYDQLGNIGPFLADARRKHQRQGSSLVPVITLHPLLERMDAYVKKGAPSGSALAAEPIPLKFSFKLRICPEWLIVMWSDYKDRSWRAMYITQPPCVAIPELDLKDENGITFGMLADKCVQMQMRYPPKPPSDDMPEERPFPPPFKVEFRGVREGSFWVKQAKGEIARGTLFVPAVHGY